MPPKDALTIEVHDRYLLASIHGDELDEEHSFRVEDEIRAITRQSARRPLIIDLGEVERVPGESLVAFVDLLQQCRDEGRRLILAGLQPQVLETLSVTQLGRLFEYRADVPDALRQLDVEAQK